MKLMFIARSVAVCRKIAEQLPEAEFEWKITDDTLLFYNELVRKKVPCDLIICDYCQFHHDMFNVYEFLNEKNIVLPVIFYNDPFPDKDNRVVYWMSQNEEQFHHYQFDHLLPVLELLARIIEDPAVRPYISLIQPPRALPGEQEPAAPSVREFDLFEFRRRNQLTPTMFRLFEYLYEQRDREVSVRTIGKVLWRHSALKKNLKNTVYAYVSRLKKIIEQDHLVRMEILRTGTGLYQLIIW